MGRDSRERGREKEPDRARSQNVANTSSVLLRSEARLGVGQLLTTSSPATGVAGRLRLGKNAGGYMAKTYAQLRDGRRRRIPEQAGCWIGDCCYDSCSVHGLS